MEGLEYDGAQRVNQGMQGEGGGAAAVRMEDLLAEAGWIRNLARSLVGDGQAADDVVQETWIAVLKKPPSGDRPLRPWLARVVTNFARMQRRGEASRRRREASVARSEALPSSAELVERVEVHKLLAGLVVTLDEPLRETVLLRYFAGLSSVEISKRTGTPAGTVRWRLAAGSWKVRPLNTSGQLSVYSVYLRK
jgi:RNA polymerase sigma-70 factor (ECF subfamily)